MPAFSYFFNLQTVRPTTINRYYWRFGKQIILSLPLGIEVNAFVLCILVVSANHEFLARYVFLKVPGIDALRLFIPAAEPVFFPLRLRRYKADRARIIAVPQVSPAVRATYIIVKIGHIRYATLIISNIGTMFCLI